MISTTLEKAMCYAKENRIPRVIEIKCPRPSCGKTMFAITDDDKHEHAAWLEQFKRERSKRHVYCKYCAYGAMGNSENDFKFVTHMPPP